MKSNLRNMALIGTMACALSVALPVFATTPTAYQAEQIRRQNAEQKAEQQNSLNQRRAEKAAELAKRKEMEQPREWVLKGVLRGTGSSVQFIPDRPKTKEDPEVMPILLNGKVRTRVEELIGEPLKGLHNRRVELTFFGKPKKSGTRYSFNALSGDIKEWSGAAVVK